MPDPVRPPDDTMRVMAALPSPWDRFAWLSPTIDSRGAALLNRALARRALAPGDVLLREGEPAGAVYLVADGELAVAIDVDGKALTVGTIGAGGLLGEVSFFDGEPVTATITAAKPSIVLVADEAAFTELRAEDAGVALATLRAIAEHLAGRVRVASDRLAARQDEFFDRWTDEGNKPQEALESLPRFRVR